MADNSATETSAPTHLSIDDAITAILPEPAQPENQEETAGAGPQEIDEVQTSDVEDDVDFDDDDELSEDDTDPDYDEDDDAHEDDDSDEDEETPQTYTVKIDGVEEEVTLDEALAGYQRHGAFTKRMQQLAEDRKSLETEAAFVREERARYSQGLELIQQQLAVSQEPDWDRLRDELDAKEYVIAVQDWNKRQETIHAINAEREVIANRDRAELQAQFQAHLVKEKEKMLDAIPAWRDESRMKSERAAVVEYAKTLGYTPEEIQVASDHRAVKALYDSWLLSKLNKQTNAAKKKVRKAPKMAKAGTPRAKGESQTRRKKALSQRFDKERSVNAAVELLLG